MNTLVVFYSRTGTTKKLAENVAQALGCDLEELVDTQKRSGLGGWLRSGRQAMKDETTTLQPMKKDPAHYDLVIIGGPFWAGKMCVPVRAFMLQNKDKLKEVAFFFTSGNGDQGPNLFPEMQNVCGKAPKATLGCSTKEVKKDLHKEKLQAFVKAISP